jgi:hypothetical protein
MIISQPDLGVVKLGQQQVHNQLNWIQDKLLKNDMPNLLKSIRKGLLSLGQNIGVDI